MKSYVSTDKTRAGLPLVLYGLDSVIPNFFNIGISY